ncbi:hypothetical protein BGW41_001373 [Actinomortierella wolfii]|nr:hypothetical protein BGW41_001373 [Actinomortierella wolfii]
MDAGIPSEPHGAAASRRRSIPINYMLNNSQHSTTPTPLVARRAKRPPGPDSLISTTHQQQESQGWVGVQYYSQLQHNQDDGNDEPLLQQTQDSTSFVRPPMVQHTSLPPNRQRNTTAAADIQERDGAHTSTSVAPSQRVAANKRSHKSLEALFEKEAAIGNQRPDQSSLASRFPEHATQRLSMQPPHLQPLQHYQNHAVDDSTALSLLRRGEKRPLSTSTSFVRDHDAPLQDAPVAKRGRSSLHENIASAAASDVENSSITRMDAPARFQQSASSIPRSRISMLRGQVKQDSQTPPTTSHAKPLHDDQTQLARGIPEVAPQATLGHIDGQSLTPQQECPDHDHRGHEHREATNQTPIEHQNNQTLPDNVEPSPKESHQQHEQDPEQDALDGEEEERAADEIMMNVDADDGDQSMTIEEEKIQNDIRVFERTFPGLSEQYKLLDKIGEGTFSSVYKAIDLKYNEYSNSQWDYGLDKKPYRMCEGRDFKDDNSQSSETPGKLVAIKRVTVASSPQRIENEISILRELSGHKNVAPLITAFRHRDQVVIVLPFYRNDDFRSFFRHISLDDIRWYLRALFSALKHIHKHGIIHRDIKPTNFLYDTARKTGILVDFGLAQREDQFEPSQHPSKYRSSGPAVNLTMPATATAGNTADGAADAAQPSQNPPPGDGGQSTTPADPLRTDKLHSQQQQQPLSHTGPLSTTTTSLTANREPGYLRRDPRPIIRVNRAGTRGFRSPEILFRHVKQTVALDIWAAGVILLSFLTGRYPFFNAVEDPDALIELAVLYGNQEMKKVAATFNRTFVTNVPTLRDEGLSMLRLCRLMHPSRFGVPSWFSSKLPLKTVKAAYARSATQLRGQLENMIAQLKAYEGGGASQKDQAPQSQTSGTASEGAPMPPRSREDIIALQEQIIATKAKYNDFYQAYQIISRHQQKFYTPTEQQDAAPAIQKPSSTSSSHQVTQGANAGTTPQGIVEISRHHTQQDQRQQLAKGPVGLVENRTENDRAIHDHIKEAKDMQLDNTTPATTVPMKAKEDTADNAIPATSITAKQTSKVVQTNEGPHTATQQQQRPQMAPAQLAPPVDQRKRNAANGDSTGSAAVPPSSTSHKSGSGSGGNNRSSSTFGWDSQEGLEDAVDLLQQLLCLDPAKRITAEDALKHRFLATYTPSQLKAYRAFKEEYARQNGDKANQEPNKDETVKNSDSSKGVAPI